MHRLNQLLPDAVQPESVQFIDQSKIEWPKVKYTRYFCYQRFRYEYPGPIRHLRQRLIVVPADAYGDQRVCDYQLRVTPTPVSASHTTDRFGNRIYEFEIPLVEQEATFEVLTIVERTSVNHDPPRISPRQVRLFLNPTRLTSPDDQIASIARELHDQARDDYELAEQISDWVSQRMRYGAGVTGVKTPAAEALITGQGLCQDFAHLMIAICREAGLAARYVSGHLLGEGGSHAWVEVLLPSESNGQMEARGFDPTNQRRPNLKYITVATGRDYRDVPPTSGTFTAPYSGCLTFSKKAGLTFVEYLDGQIVHRPEYEPAQL